MENLDKALDYTFKNEGGFSNDVGDHGGATRYGITIDDARRWLKRPVSVDEMKSFPIETAKEIYKAWYWDANNCGHMPVGCAIAVFDIGVVCGISTAAKMAQQALTALGHAIAVDGHIGPKTLEAISAVSQSEFVHAFASRTESRFRGIVANNPSQGKFLKGWVNRAHRLLTLA